jgi:hypothetical protein
MIEPNQPNWKSFAPTTAYPSDIYEIKPRISSSAILDVVEAYLACRFLRTSSHQ